MKISNQLLLYDDLCPLCVWYSGLFVKCQLLSPSNRQPFSAASPKLLSLIDIERGRNEIPLIDPSTGNTKYGLDAILTIIGNRFPHVQKAGNYGPVNWILRKLYKFISFNRKVVVAKKCSKGQFDCSPEFSIPYRSYLIFFSLLCTLLSLNAFHQIISSVIIAYKATTVQFQLATVLVLITWFASSLCMKLRTGIEYLGQVSMLLILGLLISSPLLVLNKFILLPAWFIDGYTLFVFVFIGKEYLRRMHFIPKPFNRVRLMMLHVSTVFCFIYYLFMVV